MFALHRVQISELYANYNSPKGVGEVGGDVGITQGPPFFFRIWPFSGPTNTFQNSNNLRFEPWIHSFITE